MPAKSGRSSEYLSKHKTQIEEAVSRAVFQALREEAANPTARIGELLLVHSKSPGGTPTPPVAVSSATPTNTAAGDTSTPAGELPPFSKSAASTTDPRVKLALPKDERATDKWNLVGWARPTARWSFSCPPAPPPHHRRHLRPTAAILQVRGTGVHLVIAAAILRGAEDKGFGTDSDAALAFLRSLKDESELAALFGYGPVADSITEMLWREVLKVQVASAAMNNEVMTKFAGAIELSFGGLDKFFGGLEGALPPRPRSTRPCTRMRTHARCHSLDTRAATGL